MCKTPVPACYLCPSIAITWRIAPLSGPRALSIHDRYPYMKSHLLCLGLPPQTLGDPNYPAVETHSRHDVRVFPNERAQRPTGFIMNCYSTVSLLSIHNVQIGEGYISYTTNTSWIQTVCNVIQAMTIIMPPKCHSRVFIDAIMYVFCLYPSYFWTMYLLYQIIVPF